MRRDNRVYSLMAVTVIVLFSISPFVTLSTFSPRSAPLKIYPAPILSSGNSTSPTCSPNSLCPALLVDAYGFTTLFNSGITGSGQTIVIVDACGDPTISSDLAAFDSTFKLPSPPTFNVTDIGGTLCSDQGWSEETSLDVEWAHATAPGADIYLLIAATPNPRDMYGAWAYALTNHLGNQISNSFGGEGCYDQDCNPTIGQGIGSCQSTLGTQGVNVAKLLSKAQAENVTVLVSSGDSGAYGLGTSQEEEVPSDCQGTLTVGGTRLAINSSGTYEGETAWNGSTGGGYMNNKEPPYQIFANIIDPYHSLGKPDVAAVASPASGAEVFNNGTWQNIAGTSLSCPLWSGFMADVNQMRAENGFEPAGFINQFLYETVYGSDGSSPLYLQDFHDVTVGNNPWPAGQGWSPDTGLGSFVVSALANTLASNPNA